MSGNVYAIRVGGGDQPPQPVITWSSAEGRVIKTIPVPTPALERQACRQQPATCAIFQDAGVYQISSSSASGNAPARSTPTAP
jgi:hypothetical protein